MDHKVRHIDHMMWDMEEPTSLMNVMGLMLLEERVTRRGLERLIENRLLQFDRFRQRIIIKNNTPYWHEDENFDIHSHIRHVALPQPAGYEELREFVSDLIGTPLDYSKPLWQIHLVDHYNGGSAVIWRIHHAIADGIALIKVVFSVTGKSAESSLQEIHPQEDEHQPRVSGLKKIHGKLDHYNLLGEQIYREALHLLKEPEILKDTLKGSWQTARELASLFTGKVRKDSIFSRPLGVTKKAAWSMPVSLRQIKSAGRKTGATVNDILLALMTGAFRKHLIRHHEDLDAHFRVICPVNVRLGKKIDLDNRFGMISFNLPVHIQDLEERIGVIQKRTAELKHSLEPLAVYAILNLLGDYLPRKLELKASARAGKRLTGVLSNVPGPREAIYFCGTKMEDILFWLPQTNAMGLGISIISYDNKVRVGVSTDAHLINDPEFIMQSFQEEFDKMCDTILSCDYES